MSRRVLTPRLAAQVKARDRMAPGGRLYSESRIRPFSRPVGENGEATAPTGFYVTPSLSGASPPPPAAQSGWLLRWANNDSTDLVPYGIYNITIVFQFTAVSPATSLTIDLSGFSGSIDPPPAVITGPFTVGQVISFTFQGEIFDTGDPSAYLLGPGWATGLTTDYMVVEVPA